VKLNGFFSHWEYVVSGIPQGTILGPILFIIYTVSQKNCAFLFLSELRQISTNFNKFW